MQFTENLDFIERQGFFMLVFLEIFGSFNIANYLLTIVFSIYIFILLIISILCLFVFNKSIVKSDIC